MKTLIIPIGSAVLSTVLAIYGCYAFGMSQQDLIIAGTVSGVVSIGTAMGATLVVKKRKAKPCSANSPEA